MNYQGTITIKGRPLLRIKVYRVDNVPQSDDPFKSIIHFEPGPPYPWAIIHPGALYMSGKSVAQTDAAIQEGFDLSSFKALFMTKSRRRKWLKTRAIARAAQTAPFLTNMGVQRIATLHDVNNTQAGEIFRHALRTIGNLDYVYREKDHENI